MVFVFSRVFSRGLLVHRHGTSCSANCLLSRLPSTLPRLMQGGRGGHDFGAGWQQPGHGVGASGSALWLQPQVQQAGQRCVAHALCPHLSETVPASPLGSQRCSGRLSTSSLCPHTPTISAICVPPSVFWRQMDFPPHLRISTTWSPEEEVSGPTFICPPVRTVEINLEAPAHYVLPPYGFLTCPTSAG